MVNALKKFILNNWEEHLPELGKPADLSALIMGSSQYWLPYLKSLVLFFRPGDDHPVFVGKMSEDPHFFCITEREYENIQRMHDGSFPKPATCAIPKPVSLQKIGKDTVMLQTGVSGTPMRTVITRSHSKESIRTEMLRTAFDSSLAWLTEIYSSKIERGGSSAQEVEHLMSTLLGYYAELYSPEGEEKQAVEGAWDTVKPLLQRDLPLVPLHGDFWIDNIFVEDGRVSGVIDWEYARPLFLPLFDWFQFQFSAATAVSSRMDFATIFQNAFLSKNETTAEFAGTLPEYCGAVGMDCDPKLVEALFILWIVETSVRERELFGKSYASDMLRHANLGALLERSETAPWKSI